MKYYVSGLAVVLAAALCVGNAQAEVKMSASFVATKACEANRKLTSDNPGGMKTNPGSVYRLLSKNKQDATHYRIVLPDAPAPKERWVAKSCGILTVQPQDGPSSPDTPTHVTTTVEPDSIENQLAASWEPAFCATKTGQSKAECQSQTADRPDATQFSIHGLWPDDLDDREQFPCFCDGSGPKSCKGGESNRTPVAIDPAIMKRLAVTMPGVQSDLQYHEWHKHGTCYEDFLSTADRESDPDEYFEETLSLIDQLNASAVGTLFKARLGEVVTRQEIETALDESFGEGASERVNIECKKVDGENVISQLFIGLGGAISKDSDLGGLMLASPKRKSFSKYEPCNKGRILAVE
ncbi:ribonuclease T2 [Cohaesibacter sp. ES.047]|uniref:ribonuclease T2 family protein n=1 Tax=Cohaesibacter sp. ES.047 TaxID=1798205 RepID=UPI000BC06B10|nr:ribonuclease I [Cohaesibacter sp. ES.047]SNY92549.1 ribonuclease T2 [Cohaesibacter sp. ES.047]